MDNRFWEYMIRMKRRFLIKWYRLKNVDKDFYATFGLKKVSKDVEAGAYSYIGPGSLIYPNVHIGKYSLLANNVSVIGDDHEYNKCGSPIVFSGRRKLRSTHIGIDCWIGANTIIMTGVTIGDGTIVGAGSVVTKDLEPNSIYAGVPAVKIKQRFSDADFEKHMKIIMSTQIKSKCCSQLKKEIK